MDTWMMIAALIIVSLIIVFYRGSSRFKKLEKQKTLVNEKYPHVEIGRASYQGGCPSMPKLAKVTIGIANDDRLLIYDLAGKVEAIGFDKIKKIEKFTTKKNPDFKGRSVIFYGPLVPLIFKPKVSHFCVVNYVDINNETNNLLFNSNEREKLNQIYKSLYQGWKEYGNRWKTR